MCWRDLDVMLLAHDLHEQNTRWHERLRDAVTPEERRAILRVKDVWHRRPEYPDTVGGVEIYTAVVEHGVRTGEEFAAWLTARGTARADGPPCPGRLQLREA
jgi:hypothetical protein